MGKLRGAALRALWGEDEEEDGSGRRVCEGDGGVWAMWVGEGREINRRKRSEGQGHKTRELEAGVGPHWVSGEDSRKGAWLSDKWIWSGILFLSPTTPPLAPSRALFLSRSLSYTHTQTQIHACANTPTHTHTRLAICHPVRTPARGLHPSALFVPALQRADKSSTSFKSPLPINRGVRPPSDPQHTETYYPLTCSVDSN